MTTVEGFPSDVVIDLEPHLRARRPAREGERVDLVREWEARRVQLLDEAAAIAREVEQVTAGLQRAASHARAFTGQSLERTRQILRQVEDLADAIAFVRRGDDGGG